MELDGKGIPEKGKFDEVYKYPFRTRMSWKPLFFQLRDNVYNGAGGGTI